jgi:predicted Zn-dependent protease
MVIRDGFSFVERRLQDMPNTSELGSRVVEVVRRLGARRTAPLGDEYTGPVLLEGQASAEFVAEMLVPLMLAKRSPDVDSGRAGGPVTPGPTTPFLARIGLRVLPESFSASDTPSLIEYGGRPVPGAYVIDDEGVRAKDVTLVERGRLLTLLTGRTPQKNLPRSNGHGRNGVQAGVFQLRSERGVPATELKQRYLDLLKVQDKSFGYIVRSIANPNDLPVATGPGGGPAILDVVKVQQDGREERVRGIRFAGVPAGVFRDILEASEERMLYSYRTGGATSVSVIVPNLLFEELEIERTRENVQRPPRVPPPTP